MLGTVFDLLFPKRCAGCDRTGWPFCVGCSTRLVALSPPGCRRCGRPLDSDVDACRDCPPEGPAWTRSPWLYDGPARVALLRLKFGGVRSYADAFASWMALALERPPPWDPSERPAAVTWVPLGRSRRRARGFDQAEVLARAVARGARLPVRGLLERSVETAPQARKGGHDRHLALRGAFRSIAEPPERVVLVDDVLTSGSTAAECARVLLASGALEVGVITAARSLGGPLPARCYNPAVLPPGSVVARERFSR